MRRLHWWGWIFFLVSSVLYLALGIRDGDWLLTAGSAAFLLGVLLLMAPEGTSSTRGADSPHGEDTEDIGDR